MLPTITSTTPVELPWRGQTIKWDPAAATAAGKPASLGLVGNYPDYRTLLRSFRWQVRIGDDQYPVSRLFIEHSTSADVRALSSKLRTSRANCRLYVIVFTDGVPHQLADQLIIPDTHGS